MSRKPSIFSKWLTKPAETLKSRRNLRAFFICLLISFIAWTGIKLAGSYEVEYRLPVSFFNASETEVISSQSHGLLTYRLQASGIMNIIHRFNPKVDTLFIDIEKSPRVTKGNSTWAFVTNDDLRAAISGFFTTDYRIVGVAPDTIFALVGKAHQKMVPVRVAANLTFAKGFGTVGTIIVSPDSVLVKGPKNIVDTISVIDTRIVRLTDLSESRIIDATLHSPVYMGLLQITPSRVRVSIGVEEFGETFFELPIEVRYSDSYVGKQLKIRLLTEKVKVICLVPVRTLAAFDHAHLKAYVLITDSKDTPGNLEVRVETSFQDIKIQGVVPAVVEWVILNN